MRAFSLSSKYKSVFICRDLSYPCALVFRVGLVVTIRLSGSALLVDMATSLPTGGLRNGVNDLLP